MDAGLVALALMDGVSYAALLFLVALGLTLIFGVMNILNIAHGSLYAWGGYLAASFGIAITQHGWPAALSLPLLFAAALLVGLVLGSVLEIGLLRRILDKDPILQLLVTFAAFMMLEDLQRMVWGGQPYFVSEVVNQLGTLEVAGVTYTRYQLLVLPTVALLAYGGLRLFLVRTALGRQITAVTHHREVATAMGVDAARVSWLTMVIGAALGALGGALASPTTSLTPGIGAEMMVLSFAVVATAGLGQIGGAGLAALLIGIVRSFSIYLLPEIEVLVPYLIMVAVLLVRPQGMFANVAARRI
ncbi:branched-chain amino acid ABC transporter permease [Pseudorhodoferax sp.]|uniref:branched-chain amino acid ABC transporter permease n=1 Tax=Pseudorhodoferax sp. TaxID=1993553 RepID=UPI002DD6AFAE|nr:branched-chain amino acid ABC transporter permease [Pseudorhodoferax sp.]